MEPIRDPPAVEPVPAFAPPRAEWAERADRGDFVKWAFYAGLAAGVLILLCAFSVALLMTLLDLMGGVPAEWGWWPAAPLLVAFWGLLTGLAVVLAALRLKERPDASALPGLVMVAGGLLSVLALGGFLLGGVLAIVAGVLGVAGARSVLLVRAPRMGRERQSVPP